MDSGEVQNPRTVVSVPGVWDVSFPLKESVTSTQTPLPQLRCLEILWTFHWVSMTE